jgi:hypothetical protein
MTDSKRTCSVLYYVRYLVDNFGDLLSKKLQAKV